MPSGVVPRTARGAGGLVACRARHRHGLHRFELVPVPQIPRFRVGCIVLLRPDVVVELPFQRTIVHRFRRPAQEPPAPVGFSTLLC